MIAIANQYLSRSAQGRAAVAGQQAAGMADQIRTEAEMIQAMGICDATFIRWQKARSQALCGQGRAADVGGTFTSMTKTIHLFLRSAMLCLGTNMVLQNELAPAAMIAGSILLGRALAPVEMGLSQWPIVQRGMARWSNIAELLGVVQPEGQRIELPKPRAQLAAKTSLLCHQAKRRHRSSRSRSKLNRVRLLASCGWVRAAR